MKNKEEFLLQQQSISNSGKSQKRNNVLISNNLCWKNEGENIN